MGWPQLGLACWPGRIPNRLRGGRVGRRLMLARTEPRARALPRHSGSACGLGVRGSATLVPEHRAGAAPGRRQASADREAWLPSPEHPRCCPGRLGRQRSGLPVPRPVGAEPRRGDRPAKHPRPPRPRTPLPGASARAAAAILFRHGEAWEPGSTAVRCPAAVRVPTAVGRIPGRSALGVAGALWWADGGRPSGQCRRRRPLSRCPPRRQRQGTRCLEWPRPPRRWPAHGVRTGSAPTVARSPLS